MRVIDFRGTLVASEVKPDTEDLEWAVKICAVHGIDPRMVRQIEVTDATITYVMNDEGGTVIAYPQKP